jgi:hypothetical protein
VIRLLLLAALLSLPAFTATALASPGQIAPGSIPPPLPGTPLPAPPPGTSAPGAVQRALAVGDSFVVPDASIGCQVTRRGSAVLVECRRAGTAKGTYGTFISDRTVRVARFRSSRTAQVVFTAKQGGKWRACGARTSAARTAARGCR